MTEKSTIRKPGVGKPITLPNSYQASSRVARPNLPPLCDCEAKPAAPTVACPLCGHLGSSLQERCPHHPNIPATLLDTGRLASRMAQQAAGGATEAAGRTKQIIGLLREATNQARAQKANGL